MSEMRVRSRSGYSLPQWTSTSQHHDTNITVTTVTAWSQPAASGQQPTALYQRFDKNVVFSRKWAQHCSHIP